MNRLPAIVVVLLFRTAAFASTDSIGPNGINSAGLTLPDGMPLNGNLITIGQVEGNRPASPNVPDTMANDDVMPFIVTLKAGDPVVANMNLGDGHATRVAGVIISKDAIDSSVPTNNESPLGVAPNARLRSSAYVTAGTNPGYQDTLLTTQYLAGILPMSSLGRTRAINHSWLKEQDVIGPLDGNSLPSLGMDWITRKHDVLQVFGGSEGNGLISLPSDEFNGITVAYSEKQDGKYRRIADLNNFNNDASGVRTSIDLVAPGAGYELASLNNAETCDSPPLSDSGGGRIMVPEGVPNDERVIAGRFAASASV